MYYFEFLNYFLLLIPIFLFLGFLYLKWWKNIVIWDVEILKEVFKNNSLYYKIYYSLLFVIFIVYISIFANLIIKEEQEKINENWIDIELVLDVSYSMLADDFKPNRLESSKKIIWRFLDKLSQDRLWLIVFAWKPFTSLPLNFDYPISKKIVNNITIDTINQNNTRMQGTAIWDALIIASEWFDDESLDREKIIILITDWDANVWVDPDLAIKFLKENNKTKDIKIYTIWIWWKEEAYIKTKDFSEEKL